MKLLKRVIFYFVILLVLLRAIISLAGDITLNPGEKITFLSNDYEIDMDVSTIGNSFRIKPNSSLVTGYLGTPSNPFGSVQIVSVGSTFLEAYTDLNNHGEIGVYTLPGIDTYIQFDTRFEGSIYSLWFSAAQEWFVPYLGTVDLGSSLFPWNNIFSKGSVEIGDYEYIGSRTFPDAIQIKEGILQQNYKPMFSAWSTIPQNNVTGDGTEYILITDTEELDTLGIHENGVITPPVDGFYHFNVTIKATDVNRITWGSLYLVYDSGNKRKLGENKNPRSTATPNYTTTFTFNGNVWLFAGDTVYFVLKMSGGLKSVDIAPSTENDQVTWVTGYLEN